MSNEVKTVQQLEIERDFLHEWLQFISYPIGQECCGEADPRGDCCGNSVLVYNDLNGVTKEMNERLRVVTGLIESGGKQ